MEGDVQMTGSSASDEESISISISLPDEDNEEIETDRETERDYFNYSFDRNIRWPQLEPFGIEEEDISLDNGDSSEVDDVKRHSFPFSMSQRYSESSLSSPSTPEPLKGKLCLTEGGQVGLNNLGNTCYLNSTLQCLTAAQELSFQLARDYEGGEMANKLFLQVTSRLFHEMWQSGGKSTSIRRSVTPSQFKSVLGRIDSRFAGYRQEDSQEALSIILDKLHEDLKDSGLSVDDDTKEDTRVDCDGWLKYCRKENSMVRRLFHGQLKSSITCQKCSFKSETFDPFSILNLPIPTEKCKEDVIVDTNSSVIYNNIIGNRSAFRIFCFNDKIFNADTSFLIMRREFKNMYEFRMFYRGGAYWIVELNGSKVVSVRSKLPSHQELSAKNQNTFISYPADMSKQNYLVSFVASVTGETVGFPILLRKEMSADPLLEPVEFINGFLQGMIRNILKHRFPNRMEFLDVALGLMLASANEYFKVEVVKSDYYLTLVNVIILNDKSDFNELIFFREIDDPNDLFEELFIDLCETEEEPTAVSDNEVDGVMDVCTGDNQSSGITTLVDCFDRLLSVEKLSEDDNWRCEKCQVAVCAEKKLELWRLPDLMILHLKRFSYGTGGGDYGHVMSYMASYSGGSKITKTIDFPIELDMGNLMGKGSPAGASKYELFAISQHSGSLDYGHYTAIVRHDLSGKWMLMDDSHVRVYENEEEWLKDGRVKELAYVLFYRKINK